jgi:hypothetical protein
LWGLSSLQDGEDLAQSLDVVWKTSHAKPKKSKAPKAAKKKTAAKK